MKRCKRIAMNTVTPVCLSLTKVDSAKTVRARVVTPSPLIGLWVRTIHARNEVTIFICGRQQIEFEVGGKGVFKVHLCNNRRNRSTDLQHFDSFGKLIPCAFIRLLHLISNFHILALKMGSN